MQYDYDPAKAEFLWEGFTYRFVLGYQGNKQIKSFAPNLNLRVGSPTILWNKLMKEAGLKCFVGPYSKVPFKFFKQSPIGLVPKDHGKDVRLIFHLSYPHDDQTSINANTPK